jgi:hypothetical protein
VEHIIIFTSLGSMRLPKLLWNKTQCRGFMVGKNAERRENFVWVLPEPLNNCRGERDDNKSLKWTCRDIIRMLGEVG